MANALERSITKGEVVKYGGREFICEDGFGMSNFTSGGKIFGKWKDTGEKDVIRGELIETK